MSRIVYRRDGSGVIVGSVVVDDGEDVPEGFEEGARYQRVSETRPHQGDPVDVQVPNLSVGEVRATGTIDEILDQRPSEVAGALAEGVDDGDGDEETSEPPPQGGPGSGVPAWRAYADDLGVEVAESATRDDIVAAVKKAGHPV